MIKREVLWIFALLAGWQIKAQTAVRVGDSAFRDTMHSASPQGERDLELDVATADPTEVGPNGKASYGVLITAYDPGTRLFWWAHQGTRSHANTDEEIARFKKHTRFALSADSLISFSVAGRTLWIGESKETHPDHGSGNRQAAVRLQRQLRQQMSRFKTVAIGSIEDTVQFFFFTNSGQNLTVEIVDVKATQTGWRVVIANELKARAFILLGSRFELLRAGPEE